MSTDLLGALSLIVGLTTGVFVSLAIRSNGRKSTVLFLVAGACLIVSMQLLPFTHEPGQFIRLLVPLAIWGPLFIVMKRAELQDR